MNVVSFLDQLVDTLPKRQKDIIIHRFGLQSQKSKTLASLGNKYSITRERVRQIENAALKALRDDARAIKEVSEAHRRCLDHIKNLGGVRRVDFFNDDAQFVVKEDALPPSYIEFLFALFGVVMLHPDNKDYYAFWYSDSSSLEKAKKFVQKVAQLLKSKKEVVVDRGEFDSLFQGIVKDHNVPDVVGLNMLLVSKKFAANPFGDFGLVEWREIAPKTVRDKAYLVLKKRRAPMHFRAIAQEITGVGFDAKRAHPQTVHNELIKDRRFVLVGRGLYSLKEFGIEEGTTQELLKKLLKKHGPTDTESIVQLVSSQRVLKRNTILLNLQNKKHFKKLPDGKYHIA